MRNPYYQLNATDENIILHQEFWFWIVKRAVGEKKVQFWPFLTNSGFTQMVNMHPQNLTIATWCVNTLVMGNYYCGVRNFWKSFFCSWQRKTHFWARNPVWHNAATAIVLCQSTNAFFLWWYTRRGRLKCNILIKDYHFLELVAAHNLIFFRHLDRSPTQGGNRIYRHYSCILMRVSPTYNSN